MYPCFLMSKLFDMQTQTILVRIEALGTRMNVNMKSDSTVHAQYFIPKPLTDLNAGAKCLGFLVMSLN